MAYISNSSDVSFTAPQDGVHVSTTAEVGAGAGGGNQAFVNAFQETFGGKNFGENGTMQFSYEKAQNLQDALLGLNFTSIHSQTPSSYLFTAMSKAFTSVLREMPNGEVGKRKVVQDLAVLMAHIRDCRKEGIGKGSRDPYRYLFALCYQNFPEYHQQYHRLLRVMVEFGYWKDLSQFTLDKILEPSLQAQLNSEICRIWASQLKSDFGNLSGDKSKISLAGRWAPREGKLHDRKVRLAHRIAEIMYPEVSDVKSRMTRYRKCLVALNQHLNTTEVKMAGKKFSEIEFEKVPGVCLNRHRQAWANLTKNQEERSTEEDRRQARKNYLAFLEELKKPGSKGAKGTSVMIHQLVEMICKTNNETELELLEAQWRDHENNIRKHCEETGLSLDQFLPLCDYSGSMSGQPIVLSLALGILISRLKDPKSPFYGKLINFSERPEWIDLSKATTIKECTRICLKSPWGYNTDFMKVHKLILHLMEKHQLTQDALPKALVVISDMQFDAAQSVDGSRMSWEPMHTQLVQLYKDRGTKIIGTPYDLPVMVYWNARGDTSGMPVAHKTEGAIMVSGFSPNILKTFLQEGVDALRQYTPWKYFRETLDNSHYDRVREIFA